MRQKFLKEAKNDAIFFEDIKNDANFFKRKKMQEHERRKK